MKSAHGLAVAALLLSACATVPPPPPVGGQRPGYLGAVTESVPNRAAIAPHAWTPALDEGFVPQGLTAAGQHLFVSSYHPEPELKSGTGPCRVFRIEMSSGRIDGWFDLPRGRCTHSGGLEYVGDGRLLLADTHRLFLIDLGPALETHKAQTSMKSFTLAGALRGSFATFDGHDIWIGTWTKDVTQARMYRLDPKLFEQHDGATVDDSLAAESIAIPVECQGAAVDRNGDFWLSASNSHWGKLYHVSRKGDVRAQYEMVAGLEDLAIDGSGRLWGLSESGTRKYMGWATHFPFIFAIEVERLR